MMMDRKTMPTMKRLSILLYHCRELTRKRRYIGTRCSYLHWLSNTQTIPQVEHNRAKNTSKHTWELLHTQVRAFERAGHIQPITTPKCPFPATQHKTHIRMPSHNYYHNQVVHRSRTPSVDSDFSVEEIGRVDSQGRVHYYEPQYSQHSQGYLDSDMQRQSQHVGHRDREPPPPPRFPSQSMRSRPPPHAHMPPPAVPNHRGPARSHSNSHRSRPSQHALAPPPSRSRSQSHSHRSQSRSRPSQRAPHQEFDDQEYYDDGQAPPPSRSQGRSTGGQTPADIRAELAQLDVEEAELSRSAGGDGRGGGDRLCKVSGSGCDGKGKRVKGARTANFLMKFVAGF